MNLSQPIDSETSEAVQVAGVEFFLPIALAYMVVCATWWIVRYLTGERWKQEAVPEPDNRWVGLLMILLAIVGVFGMGAAFRAKLLLANAGPETVGNWSFLITAINLSLPFAPIFVCVAIRRQSLGTIWLTRTALPWKFGTGLLASVFGVLCFCALRGELGRIPVIAFDSATLHSLSHAPAVFLEAVAVAFVFERLRVLVGPVAAIAIPCCLFALAHVPSGIESGRSFAELLAFFAFNCFLPAAIFATVMRSRDVIWIALPHYFLDVAIGAFR